MFNTTRLVRIAARSYGSNPVRRPFETIPGPKPLPLVGNIWRYLPVIGQYKPDTLLDNAQYNLQRYGDIVREQITKELTILHLFNPDDIESFAHQDSTPHRRSHRALLKYRHDRPEAYNDGGLFAENGPSWLRQRKQFQKVMMSKTMSLDKVDSLDKMALKVIERLSRQTGTSGDSINCRRFEQILDWWALGSSLKMMLDCDIDMLDEVVVENCLRHLDNTLVALHHTEIVSQRWQKRPNECEYYQRLAKSEEYLYEFVDEQIQSRLAGVEPVQGGFYLNQWLRADAVDRKDVIAFIIDSLLAGLHTTTYSAAYLLYHLHQNRDSAIQLKQEIDRHVPQDSNMRGDDVEAMTFLRDCLKESLRLSPPSIGTGRLTTTDNVCIRNHIIPKNTMVITQNEAICQRDDIYENARTFEPNRWTRYRSSSRDKRPSPFATLPFGFGARSCVGQRLAETQIKVFVARLLRHYDINRFDRFKTKTVMVHVIDDNIHVEMKRRPHE